MDFFKYLEKTEYEIGYSSVKLIDNTFTVKFEDFLKDRNLYLVRQYTIQNDERPEEVSNRFYSTTDYTWTILLINGIIDLYVDWPQSNEGIHDIIIKEMGDIETSKKTVVEYQNEFGLEVGPSAKNIHRRITHYEKIIGENDKKRDIVVLDKKYIRSIVLEYKTLAANGDL